MVIMNYEIKLELSDPILYVNSCPKHKRKCWNAGNWEKVIISGSTVAGMHRSRLTDRTVKWVEFYVNHEKKVPRGIPYLQILEYAEASLNYCLAHSTARHRRLNFHMLLMESRRKTFWLLLMETIHFLTQKCCFWLLLWLLGMAKTSREWWFH